MVRPLADRVLVKPHTRPTMTTSGIFLADTGAKTAQKAEWREGGLVVVGGDEPDVSGVVVAVGAAVAYPSVAVGDHVVFPAGKGEILMVDEERLLVLRERDLLAVLEHA